MNWPARYIQQAAWTRGLRDYLFKKAGLANSQRVLEIGCGAGAILSTLETPASLTNSATRNATRGKYHGLDLDPVALTQCRIHAPAASLTRGNALYLPYAALAFDITYCHFILLWVKNPLQALFEMKRVTKSNGHILALAEPDYYSRADQPAELAQLGTWQTESLSRQGADPGIGARLADLFHQAGIRIVETGAIQSRGNEALGPDEWKNEWATLESDLAGIIPGREIRRFKRLDQQAWERGQRALNVPTFFAWGQV